jgi:hypothetical protein
MITADQSYHDGGRRVNGGEKVTADRALPDNSTRDYQLATGFQIPHSKFQRIRSGLEIGIWNLELAGKAR